MSPSARTAFSSLLQGLEWLLFAVAALAFFVGGRAIHEFAKTDRMLAEIEGILLAVLCSVLGLVARSANEWLTDEEDEK